MKTCLNLWLFLILSIPLSGNAVINGVADETDGAGIVMLAMNNETACTATKIAPNLLITAAHCFDDSAQIVGFSTKKDNPDFKISKMKLDRAVIHPSYLALGKNNEYTESIVVQDIVVVKISDSPEFESVPVRELDFSPVSPGEKLTFVGYGCSKSVNDLEDYYPVRNVGKTDSVSADCLNEDHGILSEFYQDIAPIIYRNNVVTNGPRRNSATAGLCYGDSGGPLLRNGKIVGINTLYTFNDMNEDGESESGVSYLNLHARLSKAQEWIQQSINQLK